MWERYNHWQDEGRAGSVIQRVEGCDVPIPPVLYKAQAPELEVPLENAEASLEELVQQE